MKTFILAAAISGALLSVHAPAQTPRDGTTPNSSQNPSDLGARLKAVHEYRESVRTRFGANRDGDLSDRSVAAYKEAVQNGSFPAPPEGPALSPELAKKYSANGDGSLSADGRLAMTVDALTGKLSQSSNRDGDGRGPGPDGDRPQRPGVFGSARGGGPSDGPNDLRDGPPRGRGGFGGGGSSDRSDDRRDGPPRGRGGFGGFGGGPSDGPSDLRDGPPRGRGGFGGSGGGFGRGDSRPQPPGPGESNARRGPDGDRDSRDSEPSHREGFPGPRFGPPRDGGGFAGRGFGGGEFRPQRPGPGGPGMPQSPFGDRGSRWSDRSGGNDSGGPRRFGPPQEFARGFRGPWDGNRGWDNARRPDFGNRFAKRGSDFGGRDFGRSRGFAQGPNFPGFQRHGGQGGFGGRFGQSRPDFRNWNFGRSDDFAQRSPFSWFNRPFDRSGFGGGRQFGGGYAQRDQGFRGRGFAFGGSREFAQRPTPPWLRSPNDRDGRSGDRSFGGRRSFGDQFAGRNPGFRGPGSGPRDEFAQRPPQRGDDRPDARGSRDFGRDYREGPPERSRYRDENFRPRSNFGARPWRDGSEFRRGSDGRDMRSGPGDRGPSDRDGQRDERPRPPGPQRD